MNLKGLLPRSPLESIAEKLINKALERKSGTADSNDYSLSFREDKTFFSRLDEMVSAGKSVLVRFDSEKPDQDSKLWPRLRQCQNWDEIQNQLEQVKNGKSPEISKIINPKMSACLTGGEILLIAWIATLIAAVLFYAVYKGYKARVRVSTKNGEPEGEIVLEPV